MVWLYHSPWLRLNDGVSNWDGLFPGGIDQQRNLLVIQRNAALPKENETKT